MIKIFSYPEIPPEKGDIYTMRLQKIELLDNQNRLENFNIL